MPAERERSSRRYADFNRADPSASTGAGTGLPADDAS